jgi:presequence protease
MRAALIAQHGSAPESGLLIHTQFKELKDRLENPDTLPNLIRFYLLDNPHFLELTLAADPNLENEEAEEERKTLDAIRAKLSFEMEKKIVAQSEALALYQEATENQSLDCLPKVTLQDVPLHARNIPLEEEGAGRMTVFHHSCFTNQILYADLLFDLPDLSLSDLSLVSLFVRFLSEVGCGGLGYEKTLEFAQRYTGGVNASLSLHVSEADPDQSRPTLSLKGKALARNGSKLLELFSNMIASPDFTDQERIRELLSQHATALQNRLTKSGLSYAIQTSLSGFSSASFVYDQWNGLPYYSAVMKWAKNPEALSQELSRIQQSILGRGAPHLVLSTDSHTLQSLRDARFYGLGNQLGGKPFTPWTGNYPLPEVVASQARLLPLPIAHTALGMRTVAYHDPASPLLLLSTELFQNVILHTEIREKGGAYGSDATYAPATGNFYFTAYRDPHLAKTIVTFEKAMEKIAAGSFTERHLEEAKLGILQHIDAPIVPGSRAMMAYAWKRAGRTQEMREAFRNKILSASRAEISSAVAKHILPQKKILVSFLGEALYEKEKKKIKQPLTVLPIPTA